MCNQVKSVTLQNAVSETVREFAQQSIQFSAHDITVAIRKKCNAGVLEIPGLATSSGNLKYFVSHTDVNNTFKELYRTDAFNPDFTLDRNIDSTGNYFIYTASAFGGVAYASTASAPAVAQTSPVTPVMATMLNNKPTAAAIIPRIQLYLSHCTTRNLRPTLKKVQSAIKRGSVSTGWTCEELADVITKTLGYSVVRNPNYISESEVV